MFFDVWFNCSKHLIIEANCWYEAKQIYLNTAFSDGNFSDIISVDDMKNYLLYYSSGLRAEKLDKNDLNFEIRECNNCIKRNTKYCPYAREEIDVDAWGYNDYSYYTEPCAICEEYDNPLEEYEVIRKNETN